MSGGACQQLAARRSRVTRSSIKDHQPLTWLSTDPQPTGRRNLFKEPDQPPVDPQPDPTRPPTRENKQCHNQGRHPGWCALKRHPVCAGKPQLSVNRAPPRMRGNSPATSSAWITSLRATSSARPGISGEPDQGAGGPGYRRGMSQHGDPPQRPPPLTARQEVPMPARGPHRRPRPSTRTGFRLASGAQVSPPYRDPGPIPSWRRRTIHHFGDSSSGP